MTLAPLTLISTRSAVTLTSEGKRPDTYIFSPSALILRSLSSISGLAGFVSLFSGSEETSSELSVSFISVSVDSVVSGSAGSVFSISVKPVSFSLSVTSMTSVSFLSSGVTFSTEVSTGAAVVSTTVASLSAEDASASSTSSAKTVLIDLKSRPALS